MAVNAHSRASPGQRPGSLGGSPPPQCLVRGAGTQDGAAALPVGAAAPWPGVLPRPGSQVVGGHRAGMNQPASPEQLGPGLVGLGMCGRWGPTGHFTHAPARSSSRFSSALGRRQPQAAGGELGLGARWPGNSAQWQLGAWERGCGGGQPGCVDTVHGRREDARQLCLQPTRRPRGGGPRGYSGRLVTLPP